MSAPKFVICGILVEPWEFEVHTQRMNLRVRFPESMLQLLMLPPVLPQLLLLLPLLLLLLLFVLLLWGLPLFVWVEVRDFITNLKSVTYLGYSNAARPESSEEGTHKVATKHRKS